MYVYMYYHGYVPGVISLHVMLDGIPQLVILCSTVPFCVLVYWYCGARIYFVCFLSFFVACFVTNG